MALLGDYISQRHIFLGLPNAEVLLESWHKAHMVVSAKLDLPAVQRAVVGIDQLDLADRAKVTFLSLSLRRDQSGQLRRYSPAQRSLHGLRHTQRFAPLWH